MAPTIAKSYNEILQGYADEYLAETGKVAATTREFAKWAMRTGRWEPPPDLLLKKCQDDFAKALRQQYIKDERGRPVRAKHVARVVESGRQQYFWADIRNAPRGRFFLLDCLGVPESYRTTPTMANVSRISDCTFTRGGEP